MQFSQLNLNTTELTIVYATDCQLFVGDSSSPWVEARDVSTFSSYQIASGVRRLLYMQMFAHTGQAHHLP